MQMQVLTSTSQGSVHFTTEQWHCEVKLVGWQLRHQTGILDGGTAEGQSHLLSTDLGKGADALLQVAKQIANQYGIHVGWLT